MVYRRAHLPSLTLWIISRGVRTVEAVLVRGGAPAKPFRVAGKCLLLRRRLVLCVI